MENNNENNVLESQEEENLEELKNENLHIRAQYMKVDSETETQINLIRYAFSEMYKCMDTLLENSRETSLVYTKLEEAQMWAIKSLTHNVQSDVKNTDI